MKKHVSLFSLATLAGCAWFNGKSDLPELASIENPIAIEKNWENNTLSGSTDLHLVMGVAAQDEVLYAADDKGRLVAVNAQTGRLLWEHKTHLPFSTGVAVHDTTLYVGTRSGELAAFTAETGAPVFRTHVGSEMLSTPAALADGAVSKTSDGQIVRVNKKGEVRWHKTEPTPLLSLRAQAGPVVHGDKVVLAGFNGKVQAYDINDGHQRYNTVVFEPHGRSDIERMVEVTHNPVEGNGILYVGVFHGGAAGVDADSGQVTFSHEGSVLGVAPISSHAVAISYENGQVEAWDTRKHTLIWQQSDLTMRTLTAPVVYKDYVVLADEAGMVHFLDKETGGVKGRTDLNGKAILATPLVHNNHLIVIDEKGTLAAFEVR